MSCRRRKEDQQLGALPGIFPRGAEEAAQRPSSAMDRASGPPRAVDKTGLTAPLKVGALILTGGLLASCATLEQETTSEEQQTTEPATRQQSRAEQAAARETAVAQQVGQSSAPSAEELGINREGEPLRLGRFTESPPEVEAPINDVVELNYEQEDLRVVLEELGDALDLNMVIDPSIDSRVSLRTSPDNPLAFEDIWPLMRLLARNAGITIERAGNVYQFQRSEANVPAEIVMPDWLDESEASHVLQVTPLTYITGESAMEVLQPMLGNEGAVTRLGRNNVLGISGTPSQLSRVNAMLDVIDTDPFRNQGIRLYQLENSQAPAVAEELQEILALIGGQGSSYQVLGLERINGVLVVSPARRGFDEVTRWVQVLDAESQSQEEQLFFYRVRNLDASTLADTLTEVFSQDEDTVVRQAEQPREPRDRRVGLPGTPSSATADQVDDLDADDGDVEVDVDAQANTGQGQGQNDNAQAGTNGGVSANISVSIVADEDTNSLMVRGTPREYQQLLATINQLDTLPQQVLINAVIGQVTLSENNEFGVDWTRISGSESSGPARATTRFLPEGLMDEDGAATQGSGFLFNRIFTDGSAQISATLRALSEDNNVNLLSRPSIMVTNNQEGEIKVGQAVPINTGSNLAGNGVVAENISYRDVGIVLAITPHINEDGFINMEIFQSLSSIEPGGGGVGDNPIFSNQEITTRAVVNDGTVVILGGLIQDEDTNSNRGVPVLKDIPLFGALFGYQQYENNKRELFVILRPRIVNGAEANQAVQQEFRAHFKQAAELLEQAGL